VEDLPEGFVAAVTLFVAAGGAAYHLLKTNARDRALMESDEAAEIVPFDVTVIASHPGMLAARFPKQARMRAVYRSDGQGVVDDAMADEIVAAVANRPSIVWVDQDGFRVAPMS
jgi:hypothetical protein